MILTRRLMGPCMATRDDERRPILHNVCIRGGRAYGSDGYLIVSIPIEEAPENGDFLFPAKALKNVINAMRRPSADSMFFENDRSEGYYKAHLLEDGTLHILIDDLLATVTPYQQPDDPFPQHADKLKPDSPPVASVHLTMALLRKLLAALEAAGADQQVTLEVRDNKTPIVLRGEDADGGWVEGLLMPARQYSRLTGQPVGEPEG